MIQCLIFLDDAESVGASLGRMSEENTLMAYQLAFDLYESASQQFLGRVVRFLTAANEADKEEAESKKMLSTILSGDFPINLHLQFSIRTNRTDLQVLKQTKDAVRVSACHTATILANAFMHCGTTSDIFLRENLDWLSRATNWAKFTTTSSLGVIHKGHENGALALMQAYLPKDSDSGLLKL